MLTGQYSEILRVIGRLLDERESLVKAEHAAPSDQRNRFGIEELRVGYEDVEIVEHESFVRVSWRTTSGSAARRAYTDLTLSLLHARARQLRGEATSDPAGEREEFLRTLGQELDAEELRVSGIFEKEEAFFVSGSASGRYFTRSYARGDLRALSEYRQRLRSPSELDERQPICDEPRAGRSQWLLWGD